MKKLLYIAFLGFLGLIGFTRADVDSMHIMPNTQTALSGSLVTFTLTGHNATGDAYMKYVLPQAAAYDVVYQNSTLTPLNNSLLSLGIEHDPVFLLPANSDFSVTITAKMTTIARSFSSVNVQAIFGDTMQVTNVLTSAIAQIDPISDLKVTNVLTGQNPSASGDIVSYSITLQNIGSASATGIQFKSNFPIPTLNLPIATFNGISHAYDYINYPQEFVWTGNYLSNLNPGQTMTILLSAPMTQNIAVGTTFNQTANVSAASAEYTTGNNSALATATVQSLPDVRVTKTMDPFTGYHAGDIVSYTITYGNSGGKAADNVTITDTMNGQVTMNATNFTIGTLPSGSGGTIVLTGSLDATLSSGTTFVNTATIATTSIESSTGNDSATATGNIQGIAGISVSVTVNNLTRSQLDTPPYGSGPTTMIQAASGDIIQVTLTYANNGNTVGTHAILYLSGSQGFVNGIGFNGTINVIPIDYTGTITFTGMVGPKNYISFSLTPRIAHDAGEVTMGNTVSIVEPLICGDGLLTRDEACDTQGNIGVLYSGQTCENQQGQCVLVTNSIINLACITYQYANPAGGIFTGQSCSSVNTAIANATCNAMTASAPVATTNGYDISYTCTGNNTISSTPIAIDCGNGTSVSGIGASLYGTCHYDTGFAGHAQCSVGSDNSNTACRLAVNETALQCDLEALDGRIILVDDNGAGEGRFRCETRDGAIAQDMTIDCGPDGESDQGGRYASDSNVSELETVCHYDENDIPQDTEVTCSTNSNICETENIVIDEPILGYCGNGIIEGYEDCDDGDDNGTSSSDCSAGCDLKGADMVGCFNVGNMNISIQKGEILPFRWMLDSSKNIISGNSCDGEPDGKIPEDSMYCTFSIYNGEHTEADADPVYTFTKKCNDDNRNGIMFNYFLNQQNQIGSLKNAFGKYAVDSSNFIDDIFGEYKIVLEKVEYSYCRSDDKKESTELDRVCGVNFTVTQPYLAQKSSFSATPKSTNINLEGYETLDGQKLINSTDLNDIMVLDASDYDGGSDVDAMINTFITKYEKIAITVPQSSLKGTAFEGLDITVKVVPNQKIYILESDSKKTITLKNITSFTTPFTIVTKNIDLVIKGNVDYNGMFLVKGGTIGFEQTDAAGADRCPSPQTVKGIFVTDQGFAAGNSLKNDTTSKNRCSYGNLYVKGILMGDGIQDLVDSRRSELNSRFTTRTAVDSAIKVERRNEIFNGAAVLVEYSPSLWNALPPGASDFTKALEVYKQ